MQRHITGVAITTTTIIQNNNNEKVNAVRNHGGPTVSIRLHGMNYDEAAEEANRLVEEEGLSLIHPFDDPEVCIVCRCLFHEL